MEFVGLRPKKDACKASYLTGQDTATLPNWSLESSLGEVAKCWSWKRAAVLSKLKLLFVVGEGWFPLSLHSAGWSWRLHSAGWSWRLELEWCERKTLLPGWWLEAGAGAM